MGRIVVTEYISVDGVHGGAERNGELRAGGLDRRVQPRPRGRPVQARRDDELDALLLGRATYDGFAPVWPHFEGEFADKFNTMPKYVISQTLTDPEWNNTTVLTGDVVGEVAQAQAAIRG